MEESVEAKEKGEKTGGRNPKMTAHQAQTPPHTLLDPRSAPPGVGSALLQEGPGGCYLVSTGTDPGLQKCPIDGSFYSPAQPPPLQACERDSPPVLPLLEACAHRPGHQPPPLTGSHCVGGRHASVVGPGRDDCGGSPSKSHHDLGPQDCAQEGRSSTAQQQNRGPHT